MTGLVDINVLNERACKRHNEHPYLGRSVEPERRSFQYTVERAPEPLFTSPLDGCLTHLVRFVTVDHAGNHRSAEALCGHSQCRPLWVPVADETFICRRCANRAERYGLPTFGLIPDGGCAVSGGKRGLRGLFA